MSLSFKDYLIENPYYGKVSDKTNYFMFLNNKKCPLCNEPYNQRFGGILYKCKACNLTESSISLRCAIKDENDNDIVSMEYNKVTDVTTYYKTTFKTIKGFDLSLFKTYLLMK